MNSFVQPVKQHPGQQQVDRRVKVNVPRGSSCCRAWSSSTTTGSTRSCDPRWSPWSSATTLSSAMWRRKPQRLKQHHLEPHHLERLVRRRLRRLDTPSLDTPSPSSPLPSPFTLAVAALAVALHPGTVAVHPGTVAVHPGTQVPDSTRAH